jgi:putative PIN family toxin of toxin-antitoxin system
MSNVAVFDCMLYLQAAVSDRGPAFACFELVEAEAVELVTSPAVLAEVRDVLGRPTLRQKFPSLTEERVEAFVNRVAVRATVLTDVFPIAKVPRDPNDETYLNLALTVGAPYLVSWDHHLLDLMADDAFRAAHPALTVLDPVAFLNLPEVTAAPDDSPTP